MFVEITNILEKRKKRNLIIAALFFVLINAFLPTFAVNNVIGNVTHQKKTSYTLQEKHQLFEGLGKELKPHGLRITPKEFADACMVALYCESNLKTTSVGDSGSQGINQLTAATRKRLAVPSNILDDCFLTQLGYFKRYLIASRRVHLIRDAISLHALNFSPSNPSADTFCIATVGLQSLDLNRNGHIDRGDFKKFQRKRVNENPYIKAIYEKRYGK